MSTKQAAKLSIEALLRQIAEQTTKAGAESAAAAAGESSHASEEVDDNTQPAKEGPRAQENTKDVKKQQGEASVDSTDDAAPGGQDAAQLNIGTRQSATGEDPKVEADSAKDTKDDPGSSFPARTDNAELDGRKYAEYVLQMTEKVAALGNDLLARLATESHDLLKQSEEHCGDKKEEEKKTQGGDNAGDCPDCDKKAVDASAAGALLADAALNAAELPDAKQAEQALVASALTETIAEAYDAAEKVAAYLDQYFATLAEEQKKAEDAPSEGRDEGPAGEEGEEKKKKDKDDAAPSEDEIAAALLGAGNQMGAADAAQAMAAPPPEGATVPEDPAQQAAILEAVLNELGVSPEEVEAAAVAKQAEMLRKRAQAKAPDNKKSTKWSPKTAQELRRYAATMDYVRELLGR